MVWHGMVCYDMTYYVMLWRSMLCYGVVWFGVARVFVLLVLVVHCAMLRHVMNSYVVS